MRGLYLHIGAHKTGTTALQQSLYHNRSALLARGIGFATSPTVSHLHAHIGSQTSRRLLPEGFAVTDQDGLAERLALVRADTVVASSENFSFFFQKSAIAALARILQRQFDEVHVVSYIRRQDRHAVSHHQEGAKPYREVEGELWGHSPTALPTHTAAQDLYLDYDRRLGLWADVFGDAKMIIRVYDRSILKNNDIFADFLSVIGLGDSSLSSVGDKNVSLGGLQARVGHLMNSVNLLPAIADAILARLPKQGQLQLSKAEASAFLGRYRDSNRRLNQRFAISADPDLFDGDMSDYAEKANSSWDNTQATQAILAVLTELTTVQPALRSLTSDDLRVAASAVQATNPESALRLIQAATALRPAGPLIAQLKTNLEQRLTNPPAQRPSNPPKAM